MSKLFTRTALAVAALAAGNANAIAVAYADNEISSFTVTVTGGSVTLVAGTDTSEANASFGGVASPTGGSVSAPVFAPADKTQATAGPGPFPGQNNYADLAGTGMNMVGARGDSNITAATTLFPPGNATTAFVGNVAEARLVSAGEAASAGRITGVSVVDVTQGTVLTISFNNIYRYFADTDFLGESASASIGNSFEVLLNTPTGSTLIERYAPAALNATCGSNSNFPNPCTGGGSGSFSFMTQALAGGRYTLDFRTTSQVNVTSPIPEPETYALMLAGLAAVGFVSRRRKLVR